MAIFDTTRSYVVVTIESKGGVNHRRLSVSPPGPGTFHKLYKGTSGEFRQLFPPFSFPCLVADCVDFFYVHACFSLFYSVSDILPRKQCARRYSSWRMILETCSQSEQSRREKLWSPPPPADLGSVHAAHCPTAFPPLFPHTPERLY